jgi:hypothetical protein
MSWEDIIKMPKISIPDYDINFEYDPNRLKQIIEDWDKQNPATVMHIEVSKPDPAETMFDANSPEKNPIRFSRSGSQKFVSERVRFITDRPIDEQSGLYQKLRSEGYKVWDKNADWIRANYQNKLGNLVIPDTARYYAIGVSKEIADKQRKKYPERDFKRPDRSRKTEDIEAWNETKSKYGLDKVQGFAKFIIDVLGKDPMFKDFNKQHLLELENSSRLVQSRIDADDVVDSAKRALSGAFGKNKHDLYLRQQLPINRRWVNQNIFIPVLRMKIKEETDYLNSDKYKEEQNARIAEKDRRKRKLTGEGRIKELRRRADDPFAPPLTFDEREELAAADKEYALRERIQTVSNYGRGRFAREKRKRNPSPKEREKAEKLATEKKKEERKQRKRAYREMAERGRPKRNRFFKKSWFNIIKWD